MPSDQTKAPKDDRAERLAAALRENLKRRKAQARGRRAAEAERADDMGESGPEDAVPADPTPDRSETTT